MEYTDFLHDVKTNEKNISNDLKSYKDNINGNTLKLEQTLRKSLEEYFTQINKYVDEYKSNNKNLPKNEFNRRYNEIQKYKQLYHKLFSEYDSILNTKYGYVSLVLI